MVKKAQATLEFVLVFIIVAALIMGLIKLWRWSRDQLDPRQGWFEGSRIDAGSKDVHGTGATEVWGGAGPPKEPNYL